MANQKKHLKINPGDGVYLQLIKLWVSGQEALAKGEIRKIVEILLIDMDELLAEKNRLKFELDEEKMKSDINYHVAAKGYQ